MAIVVTMESQERVLNPVVMTSSVFGKNSGRAGVQTSDVRCSQVLSAAE